MANPKKGHSEAANDLLAERGLPQALDIERLCLGAVLLDQSKWELLSSILSPEEYSAEKHRRIHRSMAEVVDRGERLDRVTLVNELMRVGWLESVDGMSYIASLDEGLPEIVALEQYCRIVKEKADLRHLIFRSQQAINQALGELAPAKDIAAAVTESLSGIQVGRQEDGDGKTVDQIVNDFPGGASVFLDPTLRKKGLPTGFVRLDDMLGGGLQDGELIILAARPGAGKSALALNIAQHVVMNRQNPQRVDFFSLEMSASSLITRMLCGASRVDNSKFRAGFLSREERSALQRGLYYITQSPLRIHDEFRKTLQSLLGRIKRAVKNGSRLIIIDFVQLLVSGSKNENRNLEIGEIGRGLKLTSLELNIPILLLSQIGRSAEKRAGGGNRPQMSDLKDSGTLEENADVILAIFRPELYDKDKEDLKGLADIDLLKQRSGEIGRVPLRFVGKFIRFENRTEDAVEENFEREEEPPPLPPTPDKDEW